MDNLYCDAVHNLKRTMLLHRYRITLALSGLRIYQGQPEILGYLINHGDCSQKELADSLGVSPASIATSLKRMSKAGFIERTADENDRRINRLKITDDGKKVFLAGKTECDKLDRIMFSGFSEDEIRIFSEMLTRLANNLSGGNVNDRDAIEYFRSSKNKRNGDDKNV